MKKLLFVFNPTAGKGRVCSKLAEIVDIFVKADYLTTIYPTQCKSDANRMIVEESKNYDLIVCSGGDGTLNEVVSGMIECQEQTPIGYIPAGTTNDYARSIGIPKGILPAAQMAVSGSIFKADIGQFNDTIFVYVAAFGLFTDVSYQTSQQAKNTLGHSAYVLEGMKRLMSVQSYYMKIKIDEEELEDEFIYGMVSNTVSVGGFKAMTSLDVILDDGLFEVLLVKSPKNPLELQEIIRSLLINGIHSQFVCEYQAKSVKIETMEPVAWTLDGEFGGEHRHVVIQNKANAVSLVADASNMDLSLENNLKNAIGYLDHEEDE